MRIWYTSETNEGAVLAGMQIMFGEPRVETSQLQDLRVEVRIFQFVIEDI
jgi:hypothetical protein